MNTQQPVDATHKVIRSGTYVKLVDDKVHLYVLGAWYPTYKTKSHIANNRYYVKL